MFFMIALVMAMWFLWMSDGGADDGRRPFRGKPESEWIKNLKYSDDEQVKEWRGYGEEGVQVLLRGLQRTDRPIERAYRNYWRRMPYWISRWLPEPKSDSTRERRMILASLLSSLGNDAKAATPIMAKILKNDEADGVRQIAIGFFTSSEDDQCPLNQMPAKEKQALLPAFIRAMEIEGLRNNAAIALRFYPEESKAVSPVLRKALQDFNPAVRLLSAEALGRVDPAAAKKADALSIVIEISKNPDDQIAFRAVEALKYFPGEPERAVRALIESLASTNSLVACQAVWSLEWAPKEYRSSAQKVIPALRDAAERNAQVGGYAKAALQQWEPSAKPKPKAH